MAPPVKSWSDLNVKRKRIEATYDRTPFGEALIRAVAGKLGEGKSAGLRDHHQDYCGHGLFFTGKYVLALVEDGRAETVLKEWENEADFVAYFAAQSDYSCSGAERTRTARFSEPMTLG